MYRVLVILLAGSLSLRAAVGAEQPSYPSACIQPMQVLLPTGQSQFFQVLGIDGDEQPSAAWALSDPDIAELRIEDGRAIVTGKKPGVVRLSADSDAKVAEINVYNAKPPLPESSRWVLRPVDGEFVHALWASGTWGGSAPSDEPQEDSNAAYFYEDRGPRTAHVRAVRQDGLQVWQWPAHRSSEVPRLICGDIYGGVLVLVGEFQSGVLVNLDADGNERWRTSVPGFSGRNFTYTMKGLLYVVENDPHMTSARIVGLDAKTGQQKFSLALPMSREVVRNMVVRKGKLVCSPGAEHSTALPLRHSKMMSNIQHIANLAYSEFNLLVDAGKCIPNAVLDVQSVHVTAAQRLVMLDLHEDLTTSTTIIEDSSADGRAGDTGVQAAVPTGDIIVGEDGTGNFLAIRKTKQLWRGSGPGIIEEFQYRVTNDRTVKYRVSVPLSPEGFPSSMLLGENDLGYTTRGQMVLAFDTRTGRELWRWQSTKSNVLACIALQNDALLVREGNRYTILKDGVPQAYRDENYMLFVARFRPDPADY